MSLNNDQITAQNFKDFYNCIRPYLSGSAHGGFTPIGTVISVMGKQAPHNYLVCDGTVYNIADYPELAAYFAGQFEASNFFGGDGVTTFAVPDLRGEFLRGTGTNGHSQSGDGANVGIHQPGTGINPGWVNNQAGGFSLPITPSSTYYSLVVDSGDKYVNTGTRKSIASTTSLKAVADTASDGGYWTVRPTNTSVLYCIATKNIFMDAGHNYSTDEQVVGTWIDGKPIYQKTIEKQISQITTNNVLQLILDSDLTHTLINFSGFILYPSGFREIIPFTTFDASSGLCAIQVRSFYSNTSGICVQIRTGNTTFPSDTVLYATVQYIKTTD